LQLCKNDRSGITLLDKDRKESLDYQSDSPLPVELLELITAEGTEAPPELILLLINEAMQLEREQQPDAGR
jgi:hypothetical protein